MFCGRTIWGLRAFSMRKAKARNKPSPKKSAKKAASEEESKPVNFVAVREDITKIVGDAASDLAKALVSEGEKGKLPQVKYLFEVTGLYPATPETTSKPEEDGLARTLLRRLGLPETPVFSQEEEPPLDLGLQTAGDDKKNPASENSQNDLSEQEEDKDKE